MSRQLPKPLFEPNTWLAVARAYGRAFWLRKNLPPGELVDIAELERGHRRLLIESAERYGPIFKGLMERRLVVCIIGRARGRRLLKEHSTSLRAVAIQLESLFPHGFMRGMQGNIHRDYRKALMRGISELSLSPYVLQIEAMITQALQAYMNDPGCDTSSQAWDNTLRHIASSALITLFFGPEPGSIQHRRLLAAYRRLGPYGVVWNLKAQQVEAYRVLETELNALGADAGGLLGLLQTQGQVDATMLGNIIYMVELGRYDLRGLMRWISCYAADNPDWVERIAIEPEAVAKAFVLETLRMDQSERLMREVQDDVVFEGWLIPKGSLIRVCMWETHKQSRSFLRPFEFDPTRFLAEPSEGDSFSPFGLDHHHCPLAEPVVQIAVSFLETLSRGYELSGRGAEPAVRGPYHWEPSPGFRLRLERRVNGSG
jgi:cytochrome P450